ncbi:hypothetical protein [Streptococcus oricebi]|uniref:ABC transporter permease n=1 Tax=Streptococcus oricebi TaxID=1547447 RepID=A0ABS5B0L8_9STRE|nr:hypothetical protein [Streptococcus oricebi]MBP2622378.1 hypothetical protein [Streptococcus oricebi]
MRLRAVKSLVEINLIYTATSSNLSTYRKKKQTNIAKTLLRNYLLIGVLYAIIFGAQAWSVSLVDNPGRFSNFVGIFYLYIFAQGFLAFYNVFYESKDLQAYRPYAFTEGEIMVGKGFSVLLTTLMGIFPIIVYLAVLHIQAGQAIWLALPSLLLSILVIFSAMTLLILVGVHFITKTALFRRYKKLASNLLLGLATLVAIGAIILVNMQNSSSMRNLSQDQASYFSPLLAFHNFALNPFSSSALLGMGAWILFTLLLLGLVRYKVLPEFYEAALTTSTSQSKQKRMRSLKLDGLKNFPRFVWRYQLNLIGEGSVFLQSIFLSSILPYFFLLPLAGFVFNNPKLLIQFATLRYAFPFILLSVFIASLNAGGANLTAIGISLERENYDYLKVLPFDMRRYLNLKFWDLFILQSILPAILFLGFCLLLGLPLLLTLVMLVSWGLTCIFSSAWGYARDKRLLTNNWTNITELLNRDNNALKGLLALLGLLVSLVLIVLSAVLVYNSPAFLGYLLAGVSLLILLILTYIISRSCLKKVHLDLGD